jgi:diacylglycerol O-acyltransferase
MNKRIPPLDLLWLLTETAAAPTHVGGVMLFAKPPRRRQTVTHEIVDRFRSHPPRPPFNYVAEIAAAGWPHFREADEWAASYHVRHVTLPTGASDDAFLGLVARLHEPTLDRRRPLFRTWVIDGLPGERFAIYSKASHAIIDGASGLERLYASLSATPRGRIKPPTFAADATGRPRLHGASLVDRATGAGAAAAREVTAIKDLYVHALGKLVSLMSDSGWEGSLPFTARHSPMNEPLTRSRSYAMLSLPLEGMRAVGRRHGATLNDMVVALVDEGVHRYLRQTGRPFPHRLVAMCPISLRAPGDVEAATKASAMFVHLGEPDARVHDRVRQVAAAMTMAKQELRSMSTETAMAYAVTILGLAQGSVAAGLGGIVPPLANLVISNVPGATRTMYLGGSRLLGMYSVSAIAASIGLNVTTASYAGQMDFGFVGHGATMPSLTSMAAHVADAFHELQVHRPPRKGRRAPGDRTGRPAGRRAARVPR